MKVEGVNAFNLVLHVISGAVVCDRISSWKTLPEIPLSL